jgi:hypothetical protein
MVISKYVKKIGIFSATLIQSAYFSYAASSAPTLCTAQGGNLNSGCDFVHLGDRIRNQMNSAATMFYSGAAIIGIALVVIGLLKMKAHSMDSQGTSGHLRSAIWLLIIGALMIAVPVIMMLGANTLVGTNVDLPSESNIFSSTGTAK